MFTFTTWIKSDVKIVQRPSLLRWLNGLQALIARLWWRKFVTWINWSMNLPRVAQWKRYFGLTYRQTQAKINLMQEVRYLPTRALWIGFVYGMSNKANIKGCSSLLDFFCHASVVLAKDIISKCFALFISLGFVKFACNPKGLAWACFQTDTPNSLNFGKTFNMSHYRLTNEFEGAELILRSGILQS